LDYY
jgi:hypothetical protein